MGKGDRSVSLKENPYSITALTREIKNRLESITGIWLTGEISNIKYHTSQHVYLTLKDSDNQIGAVIWRNTAKSLAFELKDGMEVLVCGDLTIYGPQSRYQISITAVEPRGAGALLLAFEELKKKLSQKGLFDPAHKKPLPRIPRKICAVTSPTSAAIQDILNVIERRFPAVAVYIYPVKVQGEGACREIAQAIYAVNREKAFADMDVMIVGRGGGSPEDLWAFNEEVVAYAIYESRIPIISAVGHEIDFTIADLVADRRALTPTEAAEIAVPRLDQIHQYLEQKRNQLSLAVNNRLTLSRSHLASLSTHRAFTGTLERARRARHGVDILNQRLQGNLERVVQRKQLLLAQTSGKLLTHRPSVKLERYKKRLDEISQRLSIRPSIKIDRLKTRLNELAQRLTTAAGKRLERSRFQIGGYSAQLEALSPLSVLRRGYSITYTHKGDSVIREQSQVTPGDYIWTRMSQSWILSKVEKTGNKSL